LIFVIPTGSGYLKQSTQTNPQFRVFEKKHSESKNRQSRVFEKNSESKNRQFRVFEKNIQNQRTGSSGYLKKKTKKIRIHQFQAFKITDRGVSMKEPEKTRRL